METSVKTGFAQISLVAQKILSRPKLWRGGDAAALPTPLRIPGPHAYVHMRIATNSFLF